MMLLLASLSPSRGDDLEGERNTRENIVDMISAQPGIYKSELKRVLEISWGSLGHHLQKLEKQKQVYKVAMGRKTYLFPGNVPLKQALILLCMQDSVSKRILHHLWEQEGTHLGVRALTKHTGCSRKVVQRCMYNMHDGTILESDENEPRLFRVSKRFHTLLGRWIDLQGHGGRAVENRKLVQTFLYETRRDSDSRDGGA